MAESVVTVEPMRHVTLVADVRWPRWFKARVRLARLLIRLAAVVLGCGVEVNVVGQDGEPAACE